MAANAGIPLLQFKRFGRLVYWTSFQMSREKYGAFLSALKSFLPRHPSHHLRITMNQTIIVIGSIATSLKEVGHSQHLLTVGQSVIVLVKA